MSRASELVREFHEAFGLPVREAPYLPDAGERRVRRELLREEWGEYASAEYKRDMIGIADALGDMLYVIYGTALAYGIDLDSVVEEIHRSNMTKLGEDGKPIFRWDGKVLKGPGYSPPDIGGALGGSPPANPSVGSPHPGDSE